MINRILFIQDGIRLPAAFGDTLSYNYDRGDYIDFNTLKAVEVLKDLNQYYDILSGDSVENILEQ